ncbi:MAG: FKBP-type peptidyl-prolyl cis-trans isomerase N-terminal domain-containing protein [Chlamydiales bacterium]
MKRQAALLLALPLLLMGSAPPVTSEDEKDIAKISEAFGHLIAKNMETLGVNFDVPKVAKGIQDEAKGKESPMSEEECVKALTTVQEALFHKQAEENLVRAETFLTQNAKTQGIVSLHSGKLQYKVEKSGDGDEVQPHFTPVIRYIGKFLDGAVFGSSKKEEPLSLDETITGIQEGLVGMKEGEKRILFIHPDLAYGTGGLLPPNSLLTFEVELIKADGGEASSASISIDGKQHEDRHEIVLPTSKREALR